MVGVFGLGQRGPDLEFIYKSYDTAWGGNSDCEDQPRSGYIKVKVEPKVLDQFGYPKARATSCFVMANGTLTLHGKNGRQHRYLQWTRWAWMVWASPRFLLTQSSCRYLRLRLFRASLMRP